MTEPIDDVLPLFQGARPKLTRLTITGGTDDTLHRAYALDERVLLVVEGRVRKVGHQRDKDGKLWRIQGVEAVAVHELGPALDGDQVLKQAAEQTDELTAQVRGFGDQGQLE